ncbi:MAG: hypothetical protein N3D16_00045 [Anaerolineales bacterium]|nr:hypothetical protein [Anaerolineales bacterium]
MYRRPLVGFYQAELSGTVHTADLRSANTKQSLVVQFVPPTFGR